MRSKETILIPTPYPPLRAVHMGVFPTLESLQGVIDLSEACLPLTTKNEVYALLMVYHNTLLKSISK